MSQFLHIKDDYGNDLWFGDGNGQVRMFALDYIKDYGKQLDDIREIPLRPDDILVVGYPKSGNNWLHNMVSMMQRGSSGRVPAVGKKTLITLENVTGDHTVPPPDQPRVFMTHLPFRFLPTDVLSKKVKVVYMTRNPKDVFVSLFHHVSNMDCPRVYRGTWSQFFSRMLKEGFQFGNVFDHMRDYERERELHADHPIYVCNYEDTKRDTLAQLRGLNRFLGLNRSEQLLQEIVDANQLHNMANVRPVDNELLKSCFHVRPEVFFRKGIVGDWKNWFTVAQNEQFEDVYAAKMAGSKLSFVYQ